MLNARLSAVADRTEIGTPRPLPSKPGGLGALATPAGPTETTRTDPGASGPLRFRGASYDSAVQAAHDALGTRPRVIAANRIRRGGIGGFFATDLGVEVEVAVDGETIDQAVERLIDAGGDTDRADWIRELAKAAGVEPVQDEPTPIDTDDEYLDDLVFDRTAGRSASLPDPPAPDAPAPDAPAPDVLAPDAPAPDVLAATAPVGPSTPSRRQVDLAVVAASEMIRLTGDQAPGTTVSIQVTISTADGRSVAAEATITRDGSAS